MPILHTMNTPRITAIPVQEEHLEVIEQVFADNQSLRALLSPHPDSRAEARSMVTFSEVPPGGVVENLRNFVLLARTTTQAIGILSLYLGYPSPKTCYIGSLFFRRSKQGQGFGREIVQELEQQLGIQGYTESRVAVGLKNWPALRFWTKQ